MPEGPLGGPRPFTEMRLGIILIPENTELQERERLMEIDREVARKLGLESIEPMEKDEMVKLDLAHTEAIMAVNKSSKTVGRNYIHRIRDRIHETTGEPLTDNFFVVPL